MNKAYHLVTLNLFKVNKTKKILIGYTRECYKNKLETNLYI